MIFSLYSLWDILPVEIQEYIMLLAHKHWLYEQELLRIKKIMQMQYKHVMIEINNLIILNDIWKLHCKQGLVINKVERCGVVNCKSTIRNYYREGGLLHTAIIAHYLDEENKKKRHFLGYDFKQARKRIYHVLSFV